MKKVFTVLLMALFMAGLIAGCSSSDSNPPHKYSVTYNGNTNTGGDPPVDTETYASTHEVIVMDKGTLIKTGYTFAGWNTQADGNGTDRAPASTFAMGSADVILYAKWTTASTYTVTYNANTGTGTVPADSNNYLTGATVTVLGSGTLTKTGYTFAGWNTQADGNGTNRTTSSTFAMGSSNVILYAKWTAGSTDTASTVIYHANGGTGKVPYYCDTFLCGDTVTVLGNVTLTKEGYTFSGWNTKADGSGTDRAPASTFKVECPCSATSVNIILYAKWTPITTTTYTVTYNANGGTGGVPADSNNYLPGATVTVLDRGTLTNGSYSFAGWNTQADGLGTDRAPSTTFAMGSDNVILYAKWTREQTYTVTYEANTATNGVPPIDSNNYLQDATVTVKDRGTLTKTGYTFAGWNTQADGNGTNRAPGSTFAMGSANVILYAKWTKISIDLGTAADFAVLAFSNLKNDGATVITNGHIGVSPGTAFSGFPPGIVNLPWGIHIGDATSAQARTDLIAAYNQAAGMTCNTDLSGQNLGGMTLTPGVYCFSNGADLTGTLTLDGQGDSSAFFIFQIGNTFTSASSSVVSLINLAAPGKVFWQVNTSTTLGDNSDFVGTLMGQGAAIKVGVGVDVVGRLLTTNGSVTLDTDTVTVP